MTFRTNDGLLAMFRDEGFRPKTKTVNLILLDGGLGDHVAALPAVDHAIKAYPWVKFLVWVPDYLLNLARHLVPNASVKSFTQMRGSYEPTKPTKTTKWDGHTSPMKMHGVDYAFLKLLDEVPPSRAYLQIRPNEIEKDWDIDVLLPEKYVVLTTGFTAEVREWPADEVNKTAQYVISKGYTPVFLGQRNVQTGTAAVIKGDFKSEIDYTAGVDFIDKTSLIEAAAIMSGAGAVIGVDNGLLHVAGCTQVPIVAGFTTVNPELRTPARNGIFGWKFYTVEPDKDLKCRFCQAKTNFLYGHDYKKCMYSDNLCTKQMTAAKFIVHLENIL